MPVVIPQPVQRFINAHVVARLATADAAGQPHVIPFCYAFDGQHVLFCGGPQAQAPTGKPLKRIRNMLENPQAAIVIDDYDDDWTQLAYVLITGTTALVEDEAEYARMLARLRERYPQYRAMDLTFANNAMVRISPTKVHAWGKIEQD